MKRGVHPSQPTLDAEHEAIWLQALADAEVDSGSALLYPMDGLASAGGPSGQYFAPHIAVTAHPRIPEVESMLGNLNADETIGAIRILVWKDRSPEGFAALVRHELEHARQIAVNGLNLLQVREIIACVLAERIGGLHGGAFLNQATPDELDANAAAAMFVRRKFGDERIDELLKAGADEGSAFHSVVAPPDPSTLPARMVRFLATVPDLCEKWAARSSNAESPRRMFVWLLNSRWKGAGDLWERIVADDWPGIDHDRAWV